MVAALALERNAVAEFAGKIARPGAGAQRHGFHGHAPAAYEPQRRWTVGSHIEADDFRPDDERTLACRMFGKPGDKPARIGALPLFGQIDRAFEGSAPGRFELADFVGIEDVDFDAMLAPKAEAIGALRWAVGRFVDEELAALLQQILAAGGLINGS
nr:hypothetical protein [Mesorhizobium sp.]